MVVVGTDRQFAGIVKVDTHVRKTDMSVVYTNDPVVVDSSINMLEQLLAEDDKYKVVGFDLEYTDGCVGHDHMVVVAHLCVRHHVLVYHYWLATRPCKCFVMFGNNPDYRFATMDTTNDLKVLKTSCLSCQKLVNIQDMKVECEKDKSVWHQTWVNKLDEEHIEYVAKDAYTSYEMYRRIVDMRKCLLPANGEG
ncbi:hypothetical protein D1007_02737 [Hordeum vulgare]|nr:hypothetical protein D1007_02737 [Hordeum vulgare]